MTMSEPPAPYWGTILKSNSNGTYFGVSIENVNRDERGYVDFEKMIGLDGIALINVVANPDHAIVSGKKSLQTRITHNDGLFQSSSFLHHLIGVIRQYMDSAHSANYRFARQSV